MLRIKLISMKKFGIYLFSLSIIFGMQMAKADSWDDFSNIDKMWDGQKSITNQDFEQVVEKLEESGKQKEEVIKKKKRKKLFGNGSTLHEELNPDNKVQELEDINVPEDLIINLPVKLLIDNLIIDKGYYKVLPTKDKDTNKKYIEFYQSQFLKAKLEMTETDSDFDESELNFVRLLPYDENFVKIIFGSLDYNGFAIVPLVD